MGSSAGCHALGPHLGRTGTRVRLLPVTALWPLMVTGTIWPGSHGDMQSHRLTGLTAGQLGRGICLRTWRPPGEGSRKPAWGGRWVCCTQTDGGPENENPTPAFLSDHLEGHPFSRKFSEQPTMQGWRRSQSQEPPLPHEGLGSRSEDSLPGLSVLLMRCCSRQGSAKEVSGIISFTPGNTVVITS